jgi:hypothetical protein
MKKIVINAQHGGFSLSPVGLKRWAELNGKECYFFKNINGQEYIPLTLEEATEEKFFWSAFTVPNPDDAIPDQSNWYEMSLEERSASNVEYKKFSLSARDIKRDDPTLVQVVKELKKKASGACAYLKVVSIPDDVKWVIAEYDGAEWVAEEHRTWH